MTKAVDEFEFTDRAALRALAAGDGSDATMDSIDLEEEEAGFDAGSSSGTSVTVAVDLRDVA
jgi:hypothetical protein